MKSIRYGIIGAGKIAEYMIPAFTEGRDSVAAAVADVNLDAAKRIAQATGAAKACTDYRELLTDPEIDAIYVGTPPFLHRSMTIAALRAGKHVCCEKPFMLTQAEVREVMAVHAETPRLKLTCNSSRFRESGVARTARSLVAAGKLGKLYRVHFEQVTAPEAPGRVLPAWHNDAAKSGGGISFAWGCYDLDWMSFVLGDLFRPRTVFGVLGQYFPLTPERVPTRLSLDGWLAAEILCDDGLTIHWERRSCDHGPARHNIEFRGTQAGFDTRFVPTDEAPGLRFHAYVGREELKTTDLPEATPPNWNDTMVNSIRDLSRAILDDREPSNTLADNLRIHGVLDALLASSRSHQAVRVSE